jgi:hypothetical protein
MTGDDRLLQELGAAVRDAGRVPESFLATGRAAFAWRNVDAELAALVQDPVPGLVVTREEPAPLLSFTFATRDLTIEVEVSDEALMGQIVPPRPGRMELRSADGTTRTEPVDEVGWFAFRPLPSGMFRLYLHAADGSQVLTEWVTL